MIYDKNFGLGEAGSRSVIFFFFVFLHISLSFCCSFLMELARVEGRKRCQDANVDFTSISITLPLKIYVYIYITFFMSCESFPSLTFAGFYLLVCV